MQEVDKQAIINEARKIRTLGELLVNANPDSVEMTGNSVIVMGTQLLESVHSILDALG